MSEPETIELRRYPSRKLYNKNSSSYVRLPEVAEMVRKGANIRVEDTETGEDVTRAVLLQIILEQENQTAGTMLSADLMMDMIRLHQSKASEMMTGLFEQSVAFIRSQQEQLANSMSTSMVAQPWNVFDPAAMQEMQRQYQQRLASFWAGAMPGMPGMAPKKAEPAPANDEAAELKALRARLEELEKRVAKK
jgi:polyhydroxyalkanoate synthesis repressor PhaR